MHRALFMVLVSLSLLGCGESTAGSNGQGGAGGRGPGGLASLGIDPLGRGDGIDITQSDYTGRCYEDDELEANRPVPPDSRDVAAEEAEAVAEASQAASDAAREALDAARQAYEDSFATQATVPAPSLSEAGQAYLAAVTAAKVLTEEAYQIGRSLLAPENELSFEDLLEHPSEGIQEVVLGHLEQLTALFETPNSVDFAVDVLTELVKAEMLQYLKDARDAAAALCDAATDQVVPGSMEPTADPVAQQAFEEAQLAYDEALGQSIADGNAALEARIFAETAPSEYPPCDSEELRQTLKEAFCTGAFVNPITPEEEAMTPGITARLDAYVAEVCAAVE